MELRHLRYFYETANEMSFTRAAEKLSIAQPPLSKQMKDLEKELGVTLFVRRPHFLALTPEGEILKQYAAQILGLADKASDTLKGIGLGLNGTIEIGCIEGNILKDLSGWIAGFSRIHPAVQYNIWTGGADDLTRRVRSGLSDFAILADIRDTQGIEYYRMFSEGWNVLLPAEHPLAKDSRNFVTALDLLPYELIIPIRPERLEEINSWYTDSNEKPRIRCRYSHIMTAYELTKLSVGISIIPGSTDEIMLEKNDGGVVNKMLTEPYKRAEYVMLFDRYRILPNVVSEFMTYIRDSIPMAQI